MSGDSDKNLAEERCSDKAGVLYLGRIPHGFYEAEMRGYFSQFGKIKNLRLARSKRTGGSKHYAFIQFENPQVSRIVADTMHNYLMFEKSLQCVVMDESKVHDDIWIGANKRFIHEKKRGGKFAEKYNLGRDQARADTLNGNMIKRREAKKLKFAELGIDYDFPDFK